MTTENTEVTIETTTAPAATAGIAVESSEVDFLSDVPEELRQDPSLQNIKDKTSLVKSYVSAQHMLGGSIRIPGPEASAEAKAAFMEKIKSVPGVVALPDGTDPKATDEFLTKLGRPKSAEEYKITIPTELSADTGMVDQFKQTAFSLGLNQAQTDALVQFEVSRALDIQKQNSIRMENTRAILQKEWGNDFDNRLTASKELLNHYSEKFPEAVKNIVDRGDLGNNPVVLMMLSELGKVYKESGVISGQSTTQFGHTPEEALARINELKNNPEHAYYDSKSPKHAATVEKIASLYEAAYPSKKNA